MDINYKINNTNKYIKNKFEFININYHTNYYDFIINYLDKNLLYIKISSKKNWNEDLKLIIYDMDEKNIEELSIGSCDDNEKEIEFYTSIDLYEEECSANKKTEVLFYKSFDILDKNKYYDLKYILYKNQNYNFNNNLDNVHNFFKDYDHINILLDYIINDNIKLLIKILFYLDKNGGSFLNKNVENIDIDSLKKRKNICYINNDLISVIICEKDFLNKDLLVSDLENKKKLKFDSYLNDFYILYNENIINNENINFDNNYFNNIIQYENYIFYILSKNGQYNIEKLPNNYYCLNNDNNVEDDLIVEILNKENNDKFKLDEKYIKNKFENNIIFKL